MRDPVGDDEEASMRQSTNTDIGTILNEIHNPNQSDNSNKNTSKRTLKFLADNVAEGIKLEEKVEANTGEKSPKTDGFLMDNVAAGIKLEEKLLQARKETGKEKKSSSPRTDDFLAANVAAGIKLERKLESRPDNGDDVMPMADPETPVIASEPGAFSAGGPGNHNIPAEQDGQWILTPLSSGPLPPPLPTVDLTQRAAAANNRNEEHLPTRSIEQLAEADPIQEDEEHGQQLAVPVNQEIAKFRERTKRREIALMSVIACLGIVCLPLVFVFGYLGGKAANDPDEEPAEMEPVENSVADASSGGGPSGAPTSHLELLMNDLLENLPVASIESIQRGNTPQYQAWEWLYSHPNITNLPIWRKKQLFALSTTYFSLDGDNWMELKRNHWLDPEKDECFWFSSQFGSIIDGKYVHRVDGDGKLPCNEKGEYQVLALEKVLDETYTPTMLSKVRLPPEIALLSSLVKIDFNDNQLQQTQTVDVFLPSELYKMTNLSHLTLSGNQMHGRLPSELGLLTSLTHLNLIGLNFTGTIPSHLFALTKLQDLRLSDSVFAGSIPSQIASLSNLKSLMINSMPTLGGVIPSEVGLLTNITKLRLLKIPNLHGPVPSQMGRLTNMKTMQMFANGLTGMLPSELGLIDPYAQNWMYQNSFSGFLPTELCHWGCNDATSPFPHGGYFLGPASRVSFGHCHCAVGDTYPLPNTTNEIAISLQFDLYPWDYEWKLSFLSNNETEEWVEVDSYSFVDRDAPAYQLVSQKETLTSSTLYHFIGTDSWGNGGHNSGGMSITNATRHGNADSYKGTIVWSSYNEVFDEMTETYLWVDENGYVSAVSKEEGLELAHSSFGG